MTSTGRLASIAEDDGIKPYASGKAVTTRRSKRNLKESEEG